MTRALASLLVLLAALAAGNARAADPAKVFRYAIEVAESNLDPQRISDLYSGIICGGIYDAPLRYDYLARPPKLKPNTVEALPEISADGMTYTFKVKPGKYRVELTLQDGETLVKRPDVINVNRSDVDAHADFVLGAARVSRPRTRMPRSDDGLGAGIA